jgi:hypothetical protein
MLLAVLLGTTTFLIVLFAVVQILFARHVKRTNWRPATEPELNEATVTAWAIALAAGLLVFCALT